MVKNVKKYILILFFLTIFIFINFCSVNAEGLDTTNPSSYPKGTKFKLNKDAYNYVIEKTLWWKKAKKDPEDEYRFKKGEIVEYTGEYETDVELVGDKGVGMPTYYFRVKKGTTKGLICSDDLELHDSTRPSTITDFISENGIAKITDEKELNSKVNDLAEKATSAGYLEIENAISNVNRNIQMIKSNYLTREEQKKQVEGEYKDLYNNIIAIDGDYAFLALAYKYAAYYQELLVMDKEYGKDDGKEKDKDWAAEFDKAYKKYKNAGKDDTKKNAAFDMMSEAMSNMSEEEKTKEVDGKKRTEKWSEIIEEESERKEVSEATESEIYKQPSRTSSGSTSEQSLDDMVSDADDFIKKGEVKYKESVLQGFSKTAYNILLTIGIFVAVIVGGVLGIKLMTSGVEEKADYKKMLLVYLIGCIIVFGGFAGWKLIVNMMQNIWG